MTFSKKIPGWQLLKKLILYTPKLYLLDLFFWLFIMGLPIGLGAIVRQFFNTLDGESSSEISPWFWIALLVGTGLGRVVFIFIGRITKTQHRFTISALIRRNLLEAILNRPGALPMTENSDRLRSISPGELLSYFRDDAEAIETNVVSTSEIFDLGVFALVSLAILLHIHWQITVLVFLPLTVVIIVIQKAKVRVARYRRANRLATERVTGFLGEIFNAVQAIQVAGAENTVLQHFQQLNGQRRQAVLRDRLFSAILQSIFQNLVTLGTGVILLLAATEMGRGGEGGTLAVGDFALFVYYLSFVTDFVVFLGEFLTGMKQTEISFDRAAAIVASAPSSTSANRSALVAPNPLYLNDLWGRKPALPAVPQPQLQTGDRLQELTASNLSYRYPGTDWGIEGVRLTLWRGSLTVVTGRVGAGKTTLLRVLLGLLPQQAGDTYWNGQLVRDPANFFVPPRSAYLPQVPQLFSNSLRENLCLGLQVSDAQLRAAVETAVFDGDLAAMAEGLETPVGVKGVRLSGGQLQRAAVARVLLREPELLVLDDLSSALDVETERQLWERLLTARTAQHRWQPTCLVVSHRPYILQRADRIIVLRDGRVAAEGRFEELRETCAELN